MASFDRDAIQRYLDTHYRAGRMVVAAAGAVDHDAIVDEAARRFPACPPAAAPLPEPARYRGGDMSRQPSSNRPISWSASRAAPSTTAHYAAQYFRHIRRRRHVVPAVPGGAREARPRLFDLRFDWAYADTGLFGFYAGAGPNDVAELMPVSLDCVGEAAEAPLEAEVARAKAQLKVGLLVALESSSARAEQIARQHLAFGRIIRREEIIAKIDAITAEDVRKAGAGSAGFDADGRRPRSGRRHCRASTRSRARLAA